MHDIPSCTHAVCASPLTRVCVATALHFTAGAMLCLRSVVSRISSSRQTPTGRWCACRHSRFTQPTRTTQQERKSVDYSGGVTGNERGCCCIDSWRGSKLRACSSRFDGWCLDRESHCVLITFARFMGARLLPRLSDAACRCRSGVDCSQSCIDSAQLFKPMHPAGGAGHHASSTACPAPQQRERPALAWRKGSTQCEMETT